MEGVRSIYRRLLSFVTRPGGYLYGFGAGEPRGGTRPDRFRSLRLVVVHQGTALGQAAVGRELDSRYKNFEPRQS